MPRVEPSRRAALTAVALALLAALAFETVYLVADRQAADGWAFAGMIWCPYDYSNFGAAMAEGGSSASWLIHNHNTPEPHAAIFMYPLYVALGKAAAVTGASDALLFRLAALLGRAFLLLSLWRLARTALCGTGAGTLGFLLAAFSAGVGLWVVLANAWAYQGQSIYFPTYSSMPEMGTLLVFFTAPHLMIGLALAAELIVLYYRAWDDGGPGLAVLFLCAGVLALLLGLVNTFGVPAVLAPLGVHLAVATLLERRLPWRGAAVGAGAALFGLAMPLYSLIAMRRDPIWTLTHIVQNELPSPDLVHLLEGFGVLAALALIGLPHLLRQPRPRSLVLPVWCLTCLILMYVPITYQRRFGYGLHPMLAMMAAVGLAQLLVRFRGAASRPALVRRTAILVLVALLLFGSNLALVISALGVASRPSLGSLHFQPQAVVESAQWLSKRLEDDDVVLAQRETANWLVRYGRGRVYVGHVITTVDYEDKLKGSVAFLSGKMPADERSAFLRGTGIDYVIVGPAELALGAAWTADAPYLEEVYNRDGVVTYRVTAN